MYDYGLFRMQKWRLITLSFFMFFYPHYNLSMDPLPTTSTCRSHYKIQTYKLTFGYPVTITEFNHKVLKTMYLKSLDLIGVIPRDVHLHPPYALFILFLQLGCAYSELQMGVDVVCQYLDPKISGLFSLSLECAILMNPFTNMFND